MSKKSYESPTTKSPQSRLARLKLITAVSVTAVSALACQTAESETNPFTASAPTSMGSNTLGNTTTTDSSSGSTESLSGSAGESSGTSTTSATTSTTNADPSTSGTSDSDSDSDSDTSVGRMDLGIKDDLGDPTPADCGGKIDFLFVLSRHGNMTGLQAQLAELFPYFIEKIEADFADFDFHIMVVSGDPDNQWGAADCNDDCMSKDCTAPDYPCDFMDLLTICDNTAGAGIVFPAGEDAANKPCKIAGGHRYLTKAQAKLSKTFSCITKVGTSGHSQIAQASIEAVLPAINKPGACNDGFLRENAPLMITYIGGADTLSQGSPDIWAKTLLFVKNDDANAIVFLNITSSVLPKCAEWDRTCQLAAKFPHHVLAKLNSPEEWTQAFDKATAMIGDLCEDFRAVH